MIVFGSASNTSISVMPVFVGGAKPAVSPNTTPVANSATSLDQLDRSSLIDLLSPGAARALLQGQEIVFTPGRQTKNSASTLDLTQSDKNLVKAATGLAIQPNGDISGTPLPGEQVLRPPDMLLQISNARQTGSLTGNISANQFENFATSASANHQPWPASYLQNGLTSLAKMGW